jgi:hypothetical protein
MIRRDKYKTKLLTLLHTLYRIYDEFFCYPVSRVHCPEDTSTHTHMSLQNEDRETADMSPTRVVFRAIFDRWTVNNANVEQPERSLDGGVLDNASDPTRPQS